MLAARQRMRQDATCTRREERALQIEAISRQMHWPSVGREMIISWRLDSRNRRLKELSIVLQQARGAARARLGSGVTF